ncbi:MAG: DUF362 domain-containing protein [Deltaproteobacteria bacterium]|jgi:uncharacterized protein (DUF362 family)|nr:DUF362 domain-containing protein [Deltaproteobacteria bacterium]
MTRVGLARVPATYEGLVAPYAPEAPYPELQELLSAPLATEPAATRPNAVYAGFREALRGAGLDPTRFGRSDWNPLRDLVAPGGHVVLKPNFIRHWNPNPQGSVESVITHGSILRAALDYAWLATGPEGRVTIAEAPQMDCDFDEIRRIVGLDELERFYREEIGLPIAIIDLRREAVRFEDGIIVERRALPGDPAGYRVVDLGHQSFFEESGLDPSRFRGADYDVGPTGDHHRDGKNEYLLSETVLSADLVVNLPKIKTHKKTGVTLAIKNLVGINGDKNWLPHHCVGGVDQGGDEFPGRGWLDRLRSRATEIARPLLAHGRGLRFFRLARQIESSTRGEDFIRAGNWYGNQTTWRMCLDLNRCFYYSDREGLHLEAEGPVRRALTVLDGVVAGEDEGPLAPIDRPLGAIVASTDPIGADLVALRLMGFDERRIPKIRAAMDDEGIRISAIRNPGQVRVFSNDPEGGTREQGLEEISGERSFVPHRGWRRHIERVPT